MAASPDVVGAIERAMRELRLEVDVSQPFACDRTVTVKLFYGDTKVAESSDTIPKERDDGY